VNQELIIFVISGDVIRHLSVCRAGAWYRNYQAVGWFDGWLVGWKPTIKLTNQQTFPESLSSYLVSG
jgi:hypothetical protein